VYNDGANTTYDAATAKSNDNAFSTFTPFDFGTNFSKKADNTVAGEMRDCAECHVGGGFMQYFTSSADASKKYQYNPANRTDYRDASFTTTNSFNTFIDIFGLDGLGFEPHGRDGVARDLTLGSPTYAGPSYAPTTNDYAQTGVLEMDCLTCHYDGYSWAARRDEVRKGNFDASRAVGAGFATSVNGRQVNYNLTSGDVATVTFANTTSVYALTLQAGLKIAGTPKSKNCASCHQEEHQVDWKKRGKIWMADRDAHYGIGCMACHERKPGSAVGTDGLATTVALGQCDPAKGGDSPFDAMWNGLDRTGFKSCADCHTPAPTTALNLNNWNTYGAPSAVSAHKAAGLSAILLQAPGEKGGVATKSHIDIIDCTACHTKNKAGITGGAFVDGTGADLEGRVAAHDTVAVSKDMSNGMALYWAGGKLFSANLLTSFFWRDMNDYGYDANQDGRAGGMDALLQTHVAKINKDNNVKALTEDGAITSEEIAARQTMLINGLGALNGVTTDATVFTPRISMLTVPFKATHNVSPAADAWGKPTRAGDGSISAYGCSQCHTANGGFYNGAYPTAGQHLTWTFKTGQLATFTKVNGKSDPSEGHPNIVDKHGRRTVAFTLFNATPGATENSGSLRNIDRSEVIYEPTFKTPGPIFTTYTSGSIVAAAAPGGATNSNATTGVSTKGHILKIDTQKIADGTTASRTWSIGAEYTAIADLITGMGAFATDVNDFGFTITNDGTGKLKITPSAGYRVKLNQAATDIFPFGFSNAYVASPQKGVLNADDKAGASAWVSYLDGITANQSGIGVAPVASITTAFTDFDIAAPGIQILTAVAQPLAAADGQAGNVGFTRYAWTSSDGTAIAAGQTSSVTFTTAGLKTITLTVTDEEGNVASTTKQVNAVVAPAQVIAWTDAATTLGGSVDLTGLPVPNDKVKIMYGDGVTGTYTTKTTIPAVPNGVASLSKTHLYTTAGSKLVQVYVYKDGIQKGFYKTYITVNGAN
jgi:hypothetical protein